MEIDKVIKQPKFNDGYHKAIVNLFYTSNFFRDVHNGVFAKYRIQGQHYNILRILKGKHPEPVSPGYIKEVMIDKGRDLTRLIDKLAKMGWVNREICPDNKRKMNITITNKGMVQVDDISLALDRQDKTLRNMSNEEYLMLSSFLDKMRG